MDDRTTSVGNAAAADLTEARTREIQADIARTREDMAETIDAIQDRLRPASLVSRAKGRMKEATTERVKQMANTASETARDLGEAGRKNWLPAALIGIGTAWLLMNRSGRTESASDEWSDGGVTGFTSADEYYRAVGTGGETVDYAAGYNEPSTREKVSNLTGRVKERAGEVSERAGELAQEAGATVRRTSRRAKNQFQRMVEENPLVVGAGAFVLGAAAGLALPETERENEWLGDARERVVDRAQEAARSAAERVKHVAGDAVESVTGTQKD